MATWLLLVEWGARGILVLLVSLSVWSVAIILDRRKFFQQIEALDVQTELLSWIQAGAIDKLKSWCEANKGLRSGTLQAVLARKTTSQMEKSVASFWNKERDSLEKGLPVLGTLGSTTPFLGLLGTILGIIVAFGALSSGQMDSQKIMSALAEALTLTAVGLVVAIPAVVAYNYFVRRIEVLERECEAIRDAAISYFADDGSRKVGS